MIAFVVSLCMATAVFLLTRTLLVGGKAPSSAWRDATLGRERSMKETNARQSRKQVGLRSRSLLERLARVPPRLNAPADRLVATAGLSDRFTGSWVVGISAVSGAVLLLLVAVGVGHDGFTSRELMLAPLAALLGLAAPWMLISGRATRRKEAIERALPDTLDLITVSIEAGLAVEAAMKRVSDRLRGPLAEEIRRMLEGTTWVWAGWVRRVGLRAALLSKEWRKCLGLDEAPRLRGFFLDTTLATPTQIPHLWPRR